MATKKWLNSQPPVFGEKLYERHIPSTWAGQKDAHSGLVNLGNTCYLNASLQSLFHVPGFVDFLDGDEGHRKECRSLLGCVTCSLYRTMNSMRTQKVLKPFGVIHLLYKMGRAPLEFGKEADAHEFLATLHQTLENEFLLRKSVTALKPDFCMQQTTAVGEIFGGWSTTIDECQSCHVRAQTYGPITHLFVKCEKSIQAGIDLVLSRPEVVADFSCSGGCKKTSCHRATQIFKYPRVLKVVLNRYNDFGERISLPVHINKTLYVGNAEYKFLSGVVHQQLMCGGHFICVTSCPNGTMTLFNDSQVTENWNALDSEPIRCGIYVAFFQLQNTAGSTKRPLEWSPSGKSPHHKKMLSNSLKTQQIHKKGVFEKSCLKTYKFSPRKRKLFPKLVISDDRCTNGDLAKPLHSNQSHSRRELGTELIDKMTAPPVPVVTFNRRRKSNTSNVNTESESSVFGSQDSTVTAVVSPIKIKLKSASDCGSQDSTVTAIVTPIKLKPAQQKEIQCGTLEDFELSEYESQISTVTAVVSPIKIKLKPASECGSQDSTVTAIVTPIKIKPAEQQENHCGTQENCAAQEASGSTIDTHSYFPGELVFDDSCTLHEGGDVMDNSVLNESLFTNEESDVMDNSVSDESISTNDEGGVMDNWDFDESLTMDVDGGACEDAIYSHESISIDKEVGVTDDVNNLPYFPDVIFHDEEWKCSSFEEGHVPVECNFTSPLSVIDAINNSSNNDNEIQEEVAYMDAKTFKPIFLTSKDVPNADLPDPDVQKNKKEELQRWLKLRNVPYGTVLKNELVERVKSCVKVGRDKILDPSADGGKWYEQKKANIMSTQDASRLHSDDLFPKTGWDPFPSRDIPPNFNFGSVFYYLVESMPQYSDPAVISDGSDIEDDGSETVVTIPRGDVFEDLNNKAVLSSKKIRRGMKFLKSGYIRGMADCLPDRFHFFKAHLRASMEKKAYWVKAAISQISGNIIKCKCHCVASALGRCSHVSALLLYLLQHKAVNGDKAITCTSKPCEWNQGSLTRNPSAVATRQYDSFKLDVRRRSSFDPRPTALQTGPSKEIINDFLRTLNKTKEIKCAFQGILEITYDDFTYNELDLMIFPYLRRELYEYLNQLTPPNVLGPYEVEGTGEQFDSALYKFIRSITCTSSVSHQIAHFTKETSKKSFLRLHMWHINEWKSKAMKYGNKNEPIAREKYIKEQRKIDPYVQVVSGGTTMNTEYPGLSTSNDGWVTTKGGKVTKVLEIKCPFSLKNTDPNKFDSFLTGKKLNNFYLTRNANGTISLKEDNKYYDQVQMEMGMSGILSCDFVVWSEKGMVTLPITFNRGAWVTLSTALQKFHWEYMAIEYFARRTALNLNPFSLP